MVVIFCRLWKDRPSLFYKVAVLMVEVTSWGKRFRVGSLLGGLRSSMAPLELWLPFSAADIVSSFSENRRQCRSVPVEGRSLRSSKCARALVGGMPDTFRKNIADMQRRFCGTASTHFSTERCFLCLGRNTPPMRQLHLRPGGPTRLAPRVVKFPRILNGLQVSTL